MDLAMFCMTSFAMGSFFRYTAHFEVEKPRVLGYVFQGISATVSKWNDPDHSTMFPEQTKVSAKLKLWHLT